ncbi:MAG: peroxiredoxin-like family protein [bacterium]|jgi:peroxiredoxin
MSYLHLRPGDSAPQFVLPAVNREGEVSLDDYRGRSPVLVGLFRGLHCPFCRRQVVQLGTLHGKLKALGVETVAVVNTPLERARLYFKHRPAQVLLAADPEAATHRSFGIPAGQFVEDPSQATWPTKWTITQLQATRINPTGELPEPLDPFAANDALNQREGFEPNEIDQQVAAAHGTQLAGYFLMDRDGIIRWLFIEAAERISDLAKFPSEDDILAAARSLKA